MAIKKVLPPTYLMTSIVLMIVLHFLLPIVVVIPYPWLLLGSIPIALGIALNLMADRAFKIVGTTVKPFEKSTTLITTGVFHISRHPMYLGMILILFGLAIFMGSFTPFLVVIAFVFLIDQIFIEVEEKMMEKTFGKSWTEYSSKVRRWL